MWITLLIQAIEALAAGAIAGLGASAHGADLNSAIGVGVGAAVLKAMPASLLAQSHDTAVKLP